MVNFKYKHGVYLVVLEKHFLEMTPFYLFRTIYWHFFSFIIFSH